MDKQHYSGRLILLARFNTLSSQEFVLRGDIQLAGEDFRGLFGWIGAKSSLQRGLSAAPDTPPAHDVAALRKEPVRFAAKPDWGSFKRAEQKKGNMKFRRAQGRMVAPGTDVVSACLGEKNNNLKRKVESTLCRDRRWGKGTLVFKAPRVGRKPGGSDEWVAIDAFLEALYKGI